MQKKWVQMKILLASLSHEFRKSKSTLSRTYLRLESSNDWGHRNLQHIENEKCLGRKFRCLMFEHLRFLRDGGKLEEVNTKHSLSLEN